MHPPADAIVPPTSGLSAKTAMSSETFLEKKIMREGAHEQRNLKLQSRG